MTSKGIKTSSKVAKDTAKLTKESIKVSQKMAQVSKRIAKTTAKGVKVAVIVTIKTIITAIIAGWWVEVVIALVIVLIGGFIVAVFNSNGDDNFDSSQIPSSEIVLVAKAQIGNEGGDKFWSWYGFKEHVHWCACYVS